MTRQYKRIFTMYPVWSYRSEIQELNRQSEQGWQLIRAGFFSNRYKQNSDVRYRYQIDYPGKVEDMGQYMETYREQGWEYVTSTFNGWNYFRKLYDPAVPEEKYEIFTDQMSLRKMLGRWIGFATVLTGILAVILAICALLLMIQPTLPKWILTLTFLVELTFLSFGILRMKNPEKTRALICDQALFITFFVTMIAGVSCFIYLYLLRPHITLNCIWGDMGTISEDLAVSMEWYDFDVSYADSYYVSLNIEADSPICVTIVDDSMQTLYSVTEASLNTSDIKLHLEKGNYRIYFSNFEGGKLVVRFQIN